MEHKKLNRIFAFSVFVIALVTYGRTVAPTTSYWDCGEFIACSYTLGVPHPPGAPLFILLGRVFTMFPFFHDIGLRVNIISVIVSAFTIMFTYLIIVRLVRAWKGIPETIEEKLVVYTSGIIGALGYAFTDSFWFNAVEAEVYAVSMFFTSIVVWLILVWLDKADEPAGGKILLVIAYLIGLATGVHLLNILALPTVFLIMYFKKYEFSWPSFVLFALASLAGFAVIYPGIVKGIPWVLEKFSFGMLAALTLGVLFAIYYTARNQKPVVSLALMAVMLVMVGYSTYTALYIRSGLNPAINENAPDVPERLVSYLNREQYGDIPLTQRRAPMWDYQIKKMYIRYFGWQFIGKGTTIGDDGYIAETLSTRGLMGLPFIVGLIGLFYHFRRDWKKALAVLALFIMTGVAIAIYLNQEDPQPRERDYAYVGSFFAFSLWVGIGAGAIMELVLDSVRESLFLRRLAVVLTIVLLVVAVPYNLFSDNFDSHDRSGNYVAWDYSYNILQSCEPNAILFTNGDNDTFPLWYLQYVKGVRPDVRVVNLSLLNTNWYIKQLRDDEPKVPITLTDQQIDALQAREWPEPKKIRIEVPREKVLEYLRKGEDNSGLTEKDIPERPAIVFEMRNTKTIGQYPVILVQDIMVLHIISANKFRKPVYFAVTVSPANMLGLDNRRGVKGLKNYLRMDGLAFQVMPYGGPRDFVSPQKLWTNLFEKFQYRNLNNPDVYFNYNIQGLLQNYRSAFLRLANYYMTRKEPEGKEKALTVLDKMEEVLPESVIPLRNYQLSLNFGRMYADAGRPEELKRRLDQVFVNYHLNPIDKLLVSEYYSQLAHDDAKAESLAVEVLKEQPDLRQGYMWLTTFYARRQEFQKGIETLQKWLALHPTDTQFQRQLEQLQTLAAAQDSTKPATEGAEKRPEESDGAH
ncbi:MAG: DUF2723 domain-containing protein [Calditrichaeota bacterium]|nr:MAG: DUF2723 domain-containing protein [Calditrichota bacterium]